MAARRQWPCQVPVVLRKGVGYGLHGDAPAADDQRRTVRRRLCHRGTLGRAGSEDLALVRLAALVAVGGAIPSYGAEADAAVGAGATAAEIVDVLVGVVPVVGLPAVVAAAPSLAMALGYDVDEALEKQSGR